MVPDTRLSKVCSDKFIPVPTDLSRFPLGKRMPVMCYWTKDWTSRHLYFSDTFDFGDRNNGTDESNLVLEFV